MWTMWRPRRPSGHVKRMSGLAHKRSTAAVVFKGEGSTVTVTAAVGEVVGPGLSASHSVTRIAFAAST